MGIRIERTAHSIGSLFLRLGEVPARDADLREELVEVVREDPIAGAVAELVVPVPDAVVEVREVAVGAVLHQMQQ